MLVFTSTLVLYFAALVSGVAAGTGSVLRSLIVADRVPLHTFALASARLQATSRMARALGPVTVAGAAALAEWTRNARRRATWEV